MLHTSFTENTFSLLYHCKWQVELRHHPLVCQWWIPVDTYLTFQIWTCWLRIICCFQQEAMDINKRSSSGEWIHLCNPYQICPLHCADYNVMYKCFTPWQGQGLQMLLASECGKLHALSARSIFRSKFQLLVQRRSSVAYVSILSSSAPVEVCCHAGVFSDSRTESPVQSSLLLTPGDPPCLHGVLCSVLYMNESKSFANLVVMLWSKQGWIRVCIP